ncbi:BTB/POZ and MATH domain-containing protein 3-like [Aegilops tauschii subsp. strangulata]
MPSFPLFDRTGAHVRSSRFSVGGRNWVIGFRPNSFNHASANLFCVDPAQDVRARFTFNMLEKDGGASLTNHGAIEHVFSPKSDCWGYFKFVEKSKLELSAGDSGGHSLTIRCDLTVITEPHVVVNRNKLFLLPQPDLAGHLQQMWKGGQGADATFIVRDQSFKAHRCLLAARSPVFKAELSGPTKQTATQCIKIEDTEPSSFEGLLHFVYTDSLPDDNEHYEEGRTARLQQLLVAADRFRLDRLKFLVESLKRLILQHVTQAKDTQYVRTKITLNMLEKDGKAQITAFDEVDHVFSGTKKYRGYRKFIEKPKLKSLSQANNGYLIIRCVLTVVKESRTEVNRNTAVVPQSNLQDQLCQVWKDGQGADVTFSVGGQLFEAHRCLLAAWFLVFKAELFGPMKEKETQCIKIDDIDPEIFEALLHFIYTDSMLVDEHYKESKPAKLHHLQVASDRYGLDRLKVMCESKLSECIDVETVATTLVLAEQHHCKDLKEACIEFMAPRNVLQAAMATDGFKHLVASCPLVMKELLDMVSRSG